MASVTFSPSTRTFDPPDLIVLAAVAALATAKAVHRVRQALLVPELAPPAPPQVDVVAVDVAAPHAVPFDEDLMDRFLTGPTDVHDPDAGRLARRHARRRAGAEAQWRILAQ